VEACTVTALDAITAFAVPNPNGHLAAPSVFSGLEVQQVAPPNPSPSLLCLATLSCQPFRPSTGAILIQQFQLSTPEIGANAISFPVRIALPKWQKTGEFLFLLWVMQYQSTSYSQHRQNKSVL